jgi:hypothetical protein
MAAQDAKAKSKYGGMKKKGLINKRLKGQDRTFFDSADHFSGQETGAKKAGLKNPALARLGK